MFKLLGATVADRKTATSLGEGRKPQQPTPSPTFGWDAYWVGPWAPVYILWSGKSFKETTEEKTHGRWRKFITKNSCRSCFLGVYLDFDVFQDAWRSNKQDPSVYWNAMLPCLVSSWPQIIKKRVLQKSEGNFSDRVPG